MSMIPPHHPLPDDAADSMYQGRWTETMPPHVTVYPEAGDCAVDVEMLEQAGIERLTYRLANGGGFAFRGLEELLGKLG